MSKGDQKAAEGDSIWERVQQTVTPLKNRKTTSILTPRPKANPAPSQNLRKSVHIQAPGRTRRPDQPAAPLERVRDRKVRNGRIILEGRLDLHGLTHDSARINLLQGLQTLQIRGARNVLVITGRGHADQGVLRSSFRRWLNEPAFRAMVWGYAQAHARHGGKGAWYVFLRRP